MTPPYLIHSQVWPFDNFLSGGQNSRAVWLHIQTSRHGDIFASWPWLLQMWRLPSHCPRMQFITKGSAFSMPGITTGSTQDSIWCTHSPPCSGSPTQRYIYLGKCTAGYLSWALSFFSGSSGSAKKPGCIMESPSLLHPRHLNFTGRGRRTLDIVNLKHYLFPVHLCRSSILQTALEGQSFFFPLTAMPILETT